MRLLFRAHGIRAAFVSVVEARLLLHLSAGFEDLELAEDFVFQRLLDEAERVHVFDFGLGAKFGLALGANAHVGVAAQRAFFHVAVADAGVEDDLFQVGEVFVGFVGRGDIGLADDFDERHAAAV